MHPHALCQQCLTPLGDDDVEVCATCADENARDDYADLQNDSEANGDDDVDE